MFCSMIDSLDTGKWKECPVAEKCQENFKTYHVMKNHTIISDTEVKYLVAEEEGDPKSVVIKDCKVKQDPLKQIGNIELQLNEDQTEIVGIDLDGDLVVRQ